MNRFVENMLGQNEKILLRSRRHWLSFLRIAILEIVLIVVIAIVGSIATAANPVFALVFVILLFPSGALVRDVLVYLNHVYVITDRRVIQFSGVLNKNVIDSSIEKVNDIRMDQTFLGRVFGYGDIEILTANEVAENKFKMIANPILFKTTLLNAREMVGYGGENGILERPETSVPQLIKELNDLRKQKIITEAEFEAKKAELLKKIS